MDEIKISQLQPGEKMSGLQFFEGRVQAGFPSPAQGEYADTIDLNRALITNPAATFCARVIGDSSSSLTVRSILMTALLPCVSSMAISR